MLSIKESILYKFDKSYGPVIGVDEAGRGPLAGPVVAAAAVLKDGVEDLVQDEELKLLLEIDDSKKLSEKKREQLFLIIPKYFHYGVGVSSHQEIDKVNILNATFLSMRRAIAELEDKGIDIGNKNILVDGNHKIREFKGKQEPIIKGDSKSLSIAAASIVAKVTRDILMKETIEKYPEYCFEKHKGYGTKLHREMILKYGPCDIHRRTFLKKILGEVEDKSSFFNKIENKKLF